MVLVTVGMTMFESARVPTLEAAVCRNFYAENPVSSDFEHDCRANEVQARLARLNGWFENVSALQGERGAGRCSKSIERERRTPDAAHEHMST